MTCREKFKLEHPGMVSPNIIGGCWDCPHTYGYLPRPAYCENGSGNRCTECWDREIPETTSPAAQAWIEHMEEKGQIKDSGNRTEFATGAVRDMREGKGRCDLMPLEVVGTWLYDDILDCIAQFKTSVNTVFLYSALNYFSTNAYNDSKYTMLLEVAKHFEEGAKKYGENNWQKGIPVHCYIDSAVRHYLKWLRGDKDEPHDRAFVWNLMCCIWEVDYRTEGKTEGRGATSTGEKEEA